MGSLRAQHRILLIKLSIVAAFVLAGTYPYKINRLCSSSSFEWAIPTDSWYYDGLIAYGLISITATALRRDDIFRLFDGLIAIFYVCYATFTAIIASPLGGYINSAMLKLTQKMENYIHDAPPCHEHMHSEWGIGFYAFWIIGILLILLITYPRTVKQKEG